MITAEKLLNNSSHMDWLTKSQKVLVEAMMEAYKDLAIKEVKNNVVLDDVIKCEHTFGERGHHGDKYYACIKCGEIK